MPRHDSVFKQIEDNAEYNALVGPILKEAREDREEIKKLRTALRQLAIKRHVRLVSGGKEVPNGGSCEICKTEWRVDQPEGHLACCLLARGR